jgi:AraC-like DNA-binding protein
MHTSYNYSKQFLAEYKEEVRDAIPNELPRSVLCFLDFVIENLFDDSLMVAEALQKCNIKSQNFTSRFSLYTGATPKQFILEHRTKAAQHLLFETKLTIAQISILTGFSSHSAFSKAFKNSTGGGKSFCVEEEKFTKKFRENFRVKFQHRKNRLFI